MNKFELVNRVRVRADQLAAGSLPRIRMLEAWKPVSIAMMEFEAEERDREAALKKKAESLKTEGTDSTTV